MNFVSVLSEAPAYNDTIIIGGTVTAEAEKFWVSLAAGKEANANVALMLTVNFGEGQITRTSLVNGNWNAVESAENLSSSVANPIEKGERFLITILIAESQFHVSINDQSFCVYDFQMPAQDIRAVIVNGDVQVLSAVDHRTTHPEEYPIVAEMDDVAFNSFIPRKFSAGHVVVLSGMPIGSDEGGFIVMFRENNSFRQLIHINVRFDESSVVMNTMHGDSE
jgi:Galactoside-binding lectin